MVSLPITGEGWGEGLRLTRKALLVYLCNLVAHEGETLRHNQRVLRQKLQKRDVFRVVLLDVRHDGHRIHLAL